MADPGYKVATDHLNAFGKSLSDISASCGNMAGEVPKFSGSEYLPVMGMPLMAHEFVSAYHENADVFGEGTAALSQALRDAGTRLTQTAASYYANEMKAAALVTNPQGTTGP